ncbi:MAG: tRNA (guanosine(46)-N7)-methyltransferase TrmB [Aquirufa sp.]
MSRSKQHKYDLAEELDNVIQSPMDFHSACKGKWKSDFFKNDHPIVLEIGCGKGEYTLGLGKLFPEKNFIGVDIKGDRLASGGLNAKKQLLDNVCFLRIHVQFITDFFNENEIDEIWITFPDPRPKDRDEKKRLTNPFFLEKYHLILKPEGLLHLKTDSDSLFDYSIETIEKPQWEKLVLTKDLYQSTWNNDHFGIKTRFEEIFYNKGFSIKYLRAVNKKEAR